MHKRRFSISWTRQSRYCLGFREKDVWRNLTDKDINTMVCNCVDETEVNVSASEMWTALQSDRVPSVHPLRAWLNPLPEYTPEQPDWIDFVAQQVNEIAKANQDNWTT